MPNEISFNPFSDIIENNVTPHALTLRSSFSEKIISTIEVISGTIELEKSMHVGIFDYLTFFIPYGINKLSKYLDEKESKSWPMSLISLGINLINDFLVGCRIVAGLLGAILAVLIIFAVHTVSYLASYSDRKNIEAIKVDGEVTLGEKLKGKRSDLETLEVKYQWGSDSKKIELTVIPGPVSNDVLAVLGKPSPEKFTITLNEENAAGFKSLFNLNLNNVTDLLILYNSDIKDKESLDAYLTPTCQK